MLGLESSSEGKKSLSRRKHLKEMLRSYSPPTATEQEFWERMLQLLESAGDPFSRGHYEPGHFTASSFILSPDQKSLLLIYHSKLHRWLQPGGHVDPEDVNIVASAQREVREEVGLSDLELVSNGIFDVDIHEIPARKKEPAHDHYDVRFVFQAPDLSFAAGSDALEARWGPLTEITEVESDRAVMRAVEKLLKG